MKKDLSTYPGVVVDTGVWIEYFLETTLGQKFKEKIVEGRISIYMAVSKSMGFPALFKEEEEIRQEINKKAFDVDLYFLEDI